MATTLDKRLERLSSEGNGFPGIVNGFNHYFNPLYVRTGLRRWGFSKDTSRKVAYAYEGFYNPLMGGIKYICGRA